MSEIKNILVLGGTGFVGRNLCEQLVERGGGGGRIVVATRRLRHGQAVQSLPTVELVEADVHNDAALRSLLRGVDAVVNLIAVLHGDEARFQRIHVELPRRLAQACETAGVRRVVHVSALGARSDAPSRYLRSKAGGESALRGTHLDLTVLRPSVIFGAEDRFTNLFARLQALFPVMPLAGADARFQPVWVNDVAAAIVRCLEQPQTIGQVIECAGPEVYKLGELVALCGRWSGHERLVLPLPSALGRLQALAMECLPGEPLMSRDNLDSMQVPNVASGHFPGLDSLGIKPAGLSSVAPDYLDRHSGVARLNRWRARRT
jgi:uncharacterized protein YbjT (DUF2867 family)